MTERESRRLKDRLAKARLRQSAAVEDVDLRTPRGLDIVNSPPTDLRSSRGHRPMPSP
jgi:hypothetical protein